jgi:hypothetical protein
LLLLAASKRIGWVAVDDIRAESNEHDRRAARAIHGADWSLPLKADQQPNDADIASMDVVLNP